MRADLTRAATMAYRCLLRLNVTALPVHPENMLRLCRDTVLMTFSEAAEQLNVDRAAFERQSGAADAFTVRVTLTDGSQRHVVCYQEDGNRARLNFTLAHELGHIVLNHSGESAAEEAEADCFASYLLCPRPVLKQLASCGSTIFAEQIAALCYISVSAAEKIARQSPVRVDEMLEKKIADQLSAIEDFAENKTKDAAFWHTIIDPGA